MTSSAIETPTAERLSTDELQRTDAYWRACMYLSAGMIYLRSNPLLREPLKAEHVKQRLLGHWGTSPGLSFTYVHLNRLINKYDLDAIFLAGPGHGAPGVLAPVYLEGTYSEVYPNKAEDEEGMTLFFKEFSFPGGIGSHCTPETPGSIHEGGELGYSISHAFGAAFDKSGTARRGRGWRWRSGDRTTRHLMALKQVPESHSRRRGAADRASQRLQD
jgi:xylulose-5-phosphate/fructose-6-phosphate phosphoketolase